MREIWSLGGMIREIMLVPFPRAASRLFMSLFIFHISTFLSAESSPGNILLPLLAVAMTDNMQVRTGREGGNKQLEIKRTL